MKPHQSGLGGAPTFTLRNRAFRLLWMVTWFLLASWTPTKMRGWRRMILRAFGATVHDTAGVRGSARIWYPPNLILHAGSSIGPRANIYNVDKIEIGPRTVISQDTFLCTASHDYNDPAFLLVTRPIRIGAQCWIASEAFVGPGVIVHDGVVLGARGAVFVDLDPWTIYRGNPASAVKPRKPLETSCN